MSHHPQRQANQHFLVTGAGSGIGRAIALRLASEGACLTLLARNNSRLEQTREQAREQSPDAKINVFAADIRDRDSVAASVADAASKFGAFHGVIANSGVGGPNTPGPEDRFDELIQTNLIGTYSTLRAVEQHLAPGPDTRHMVVISSCLARFGVPGHTGYCASKAALLGLVRALSLEIASQGVQVNAVCPGWIDTEMAWAGIDGLAQAMSVSREEAHRTAMEAVPLGRMGTPEEVAGMVAWLVSPDAAGVTGQGLDMNGGSWMG